MEVFLPLLFVVAAFYFILLRPVLRQQRRRRRDLVDLDVGDEVLTTGGFYAIVRAIRTREAGPQEIMLEVAPGVELRATPDAIQHVTPHTSEGAPEGAGSADETDSA